MTDIPPERCSASAVVSIKENMGADRCWCASRSSKPVRTANSRLDEFDPHMPPPKATRRMESIRRVALLFTPFPAESVEKAVG